MYCKIVKPIDYNSQQWKKYCLWRNYNFTDFRSLDSNLRESAFEVVEDEDWAHVLTMGDKLTDVITDVDYARKILPRYGNALIERFEFADEGPSIENIMGYDILDGWMSYSLLTNFGNDIEVVNSHLTRNGLIRQWEQIKKSHEWLLANTKDTGHIPGSRIVAVYSEFG